MLHHMYAESRKWNNYKDQLQAEYLLKMPQSKRERIQKIMEQTSRQIDAEKEQNKKLLDEIERKHLNEENAIFDKELQTYTSKSRSRLINTLKCLKSSKIYSACPCHRHNDSNIEKTSMHEKFISNQDFPKLIAICLNVQHNC